jgi:predicted SPOUT superfamily RNA methylase MTH1
MATAANPPPPPAENAPYSHTAAINLCVAIPDSSISDQQAKRDKSIKIAQFARAFSIFRVKRIYIYHDRTSNINKQDPYILRTILGYLDTPQYLRRRLYPLTPELQYAGILHPIKAPHHKKFENAKSIKTGDTRVGVVVKLKGAIYVDVGLGMMIPCENISTAEEGKKVNVKFISAYPNLKVTKASAEDMNSVYWGYEITQASSLHGLLKEAKNKKDTEIMITSRNGSTFKSKEAELLRSLKLARNLLIVFGAPKRGVEQILFGEGQSRDLYNFTVNVFPFQGTETVRLEEAIFGTLAILNNLLSDTAMRWS